MTSEDPGQQEGHTDQAPDKTTPAAPPQGNFFAQLRERNVIKVGATYVVAAWMIIQVADVMFGALDFPPWALKLTVVILIVGMPVTVIGAWIYELTPQGLRRDKRDLEHTPRLSPRQRLIDICIIVLLVGGAGYIGYSNIPRLLERQAQVTSLDGEMSFVEIDSNSVAVLAFDNRSTDPEVEYFADGVAEEIHTVLFKLKELKVAPFAASFYYKGKDVPLEEMARKMRVKFLLSGSVYRAGNQIRITARLSDAESGEERWKQTYDRQFENVFEVQSEIAQAVADKSKVELSPASQDLLLERPTTELAAYDFYLQGRDYLRRPRTVSVLNTAASLFRKALVIDDAFALAHAGLCESHLDLYQLTKETNWVEVAEQSCESALAKDASLSVVHAAIGELYRQTGQLDAAELRFRKALELDERLFEAMEGLAHTLVDKKDFDAAKSVMDRLLEMQPGYWRSYTVLGNFLYRQGRDEEAIVYFRRVTNLTPDNALGWNSLGAAQYMVGNLEEAAKAWQKAIEIAPSQHMYVNLGSMYYYLGRYDKAAEMQRKALEVAPEDFRIWGRLAAVLNQQEDKQVEAKAAYAEAIRFAKAVLAVNPDQADALKNIGLFHAQTGDASRALEMTERSLALTPKDPDTHFFAALVYCVLGDQQSCMTQLELSVSFGYSIDLIEKEPMLADLRHTDEFRLLLSSAD